MKLNKLLVLNAAGVFKGLKFKQAARHFAIT